MYCTECGASLAPKAKFCGQCGTRIAAVDPEATPDIEAVEPDVLDVVEPLPESVEAEAAVADADADAEPVAVSEFGADPVAEDPGTEHPDDAAEPTTEDAPPDPAPLADIDASETSPRRGALIAATAAGLVALLAGGWWVVSGQTDRMEAPLDAPSPVTAADDTAETDGVGSVDEHEPADAVPAATAAFQAARATGRITPLGEFARAYPDSEHVAQAKALARASALRQDSELARSTYTRFFDETLEPAEPGVAPAQPDGTGLVETAAPAVVEAAPETTTQTLLETAPAATPAPDTPSQGRMEYADGKVYDGIIVGGRPNGEGRMTLADGTVYEGGFVDGVREGRGTLEASDGLRYVGDFQGGRFNGDGKLSFAPGGELVSYEGRFRDNAPDGTGTLIFRDGTLYTGDFRAGQRTGRGLIVFDDGSRYEGEFVDGVMTGLGTATYADGETVTGRFEDGLYVGAE